MIIEFKHTNIISSDWQTLSSFYQNVFGCIPVPPQRKLSGNWLDKGTGIDSTQIEGIHLLLPGYGDTGPTLEIMQYSNNLSKSIPAANREGFGHIAFEVDNINKATQKVLQHGGAKVGEETSGEVEGLGLISFVYLAGSSSLAPPFFD